LLLFFADLGLFCKHKLYQPKQPLAAIFYPLPIIAESFNNPFLPFVSSTFTVIFS
jgi:hypothetical protein